MASIKIISGKNKPSGSAGLLALEAGEANYFEVADWMPQSVGSPGGGLIPPGPAEIEKPKQITWKLKDKEQKQEFFSVTSSVLEKVRLLINKKYSGSYSYYLEASLNGTAEKANIFIKGLCDPNITVAKWSKKEASADQSELNYGNDVFIELETEGLNGELLTLEVCSKKDNKTVGTDKKECINGKLQAKFTTLPFLAALNKPQELEEFYVKAKNLSGTYIKGASKKEEILSFSIKNKTVSPEVEKPGNNAALKVGKPDKEIISVGFISLEKIVVTTKYDVCNDEVEHFSDFKNFWILEHQNEYFHWLKKPLIGIKEADDKNKPAEIPITLASTDKFEFKATFKTIFPIDGLQVRVRDKDGKYLFEEKPYPKKNKDEEHTVTFISKGSPYEKTLQFFPNFELIFDFSLDGKSWTPLGSARFCLYLTWKTPLWGSFDGNPTEKKSMQIRRNSVRNIPETVLWLGCTQAMGAGNFHKSVEENEGQIIELLFKVFQTKKVARCRENRTPAVLKNKITDGVIGYWRGVGDANTTTFGMLRCVKYMLTNGEGRCGEWASFLRHLCYCQGITSVIDLPFISEALLTAYQPITGLSRFDTTKSPRDSAGEVPVTHDRVNIIDTIKYNQKVKGVFLVNSPAGSWDTNPVTDPPVQLKAEAQGNYNPLHFFWDHVFMAHKKGTSIRYYDPSYGAKGGSYHANKDLLFAEYTKSNLAAIVEVSIPQTGGQKFEDIKHTKKYVNFFKAYDFTPNINEVPAFTFNCIKSNMEKNIIY